MSAAPAPVATAPYYGIPMLKRPLWRWEIACYFFLEGISAGAFVIGALADITGRGRHARLIRAARYASMAALLPCPPLLIADLGRPGRFHHMLRVFKPNSPMNLGAWTLLVYSAPVGAMAAVQLAHDRPQVVPAVARRIMRLLPGRAMALAGLAPALVMLSYPGVLLSTTSTPLWSRSRFVGALLAASSFSAAIATLSLLLGREESALSSARLRKLELAAGAAEGAALGAYLLTARSFAKPLTQGRYRPHLLTAAVAGIALPMLLAAGRRKKTSALAALMTIAGSFALKWAMVHAGRDSADDAAAAHRAARPDASAPGWNAPAVAPVGLPHAERIPEVAA